jgi:uncharacterized DUF497 family protein
MKFEWDERKNQLNIEKHKVSFEDAETVFEDDFAVQPINNEKEVYRDLEVIING